MMRTARAKWFFMAALMAAAGCGGGDDGGPTILGFTPSVRAEMRRAVAAADPKADAKQVVDDYMVKVRERAEQMKIKPNAAGDYLYPGAQETELAKWRKGDFMEVARDFDLQLPRWAEPLADEYQAGSISSIRRELLMNVVIFELVDGLSK